MTSGVLPGGCANKVGCFLWELAIQISFQVGIVRKERPNPPCPAVSVPLVPIESLLNRFWPNNRYFTSADSWTGAD